MYCTHCLLFCSIILKYFTMKEHLSHFHVAGFTFYDGVDVFNKLKVGKKVKFKLEEDNKWDPRAVAIYFKGAKIGFIPRTENRIFYKLLKVGITQFEARIQKSILNNTPKDR